MTNKLEELLVALNAAHMNAALRHNLSHDALRLATIGSGSFTQAVAAALMTLGGTHAPLVETCRLLRMNDPIEWVHMSVSLNRPVAGWGNSFVKGAPDPMWSEVDVLLRDTAPDTMARVDVITETLHAAGKPVYPNPSCYTAATSILLGLPDAASPYLFIHGRLDAWLQEFVALLPQVKVRT